LLNSPNRVTLTIQPRQSFEACRLKGMRRHDQAACFSAPSSRERGFGWEVSRSRFTSGQNRLGNSAFAGGQRCAVGISKLGNGWLYPFLAALILADWGLSGCRIIMLASANAALMHCFYPIIKQRFRRPRPFSVDPNCRPCSRHSTRIPFQADTS